MHHKQIWNKYNIIQFKFIQYTLLVKKKNWSEFMKGGNMKTELVLLLYFTIGNYKAREKIIRIQSVYLCIY